MGATFPNGIASFKTHVDRIDPVNAADVNKIQDEVVAIEEVLGDAINTLEIIEDEVDELDSEVNTLQNIDTRLVKKFKNLKELIATLWDGGNIYAAIAQATNKKLRNTPADRPFPPDLVNLGKPDQNHDPMGLWNGTGFTLKKAGFWVAMGQVQVNLAETGPSSNNNFGTYEASVSINGSDWTRSLDRRYPVVDKTWHDVILTPYLAGWFPKGTKFTLRAAQSSNLDQNIKQAHLSVYRVRGR